MSVPDKHYLPTFPIMMTQTEADPSAVASAQVGYQLQGIYTQEMIAPPSNLTNRIENFCPDFDKAGFDIVIARVRQLEALLGEPVGNEASPSTPRLPQSRIRFDNNGLTQVVAGLGLLESAYMSSQKEVAALTKLVEKHKRRANGMVLSIEQMRERMHILEMRLDATSEFQNGKSDAFLHAVDCVVARQYPHIVERLENAQEVFCSRVEQQPTIHGWFSLLHTLPFDERPAQDEDCGTVNILNEEHIEQQNQHNKRSSEAWFKEQDFVVRPITKVERKITRN